MSGDHSFISDVNRPKVRPEWLVFNDVPSPREKQHSIQLVLPPYVAEIAAPNGKKRVLQNEQSRFSLAREVMQFSGLNDLRRALTVASSTSSPVLPPKPFLAARA
jgi:hypothetical protein